MAAWEVEGTARRDQSDAERVVEGLARDRALAELHEVLPGKYANQAEQIYRATSRARGSRSRRTRRSVRAGSR